MSDEQEALIDRMLSGEPFTYGALASLRNGDKDRLVDKTIQKLRRAGKIAFAREEGRVVWRVVAPGSKRRRTGVENER